MKNIILEDSGKNKKEKKRFIKRVINIIFSDNDIQSIFDNKKFITNSDKFYIIKLENKDIGFIRLRDNGIPNTYFLDIGIKEKYRGKNYSKRALQELYLKVSDKYILAEVSDTNEQELKVGGKLSHPISNIDGFTLLFLGNENKLDQFLLNIKLKELKDYFDLQYVRSLSKKDSLTGKSFVKKR